jgi:tetratricopeptide (TPR) repeat protein
MTLAYKKAREICLESINVSKRLLEHSNIEKAEVEHKLFFSLLNLGVAEHRLGCFEKALVAYQDTLKLARERNNELWVGYVLQEMGELYHGMENRSLAQETLNDALNLYRQNSAKSDEETLENFILVNGYTLSESSYLGEE